MPTLTSKRILNPISRPKNPPLLHFMIYAYLGYHLILGPPYFGYAPTMGLYPKTRLFAYALLCVL